MKKLSSGIEMEVAWISPYGDIYWLPFREVHSIEIQRLFDEGVFVPTDQVLRRNGFDRADRGKIREVAYELALDDGWIRFFGGTTGRLSFEMTSQRKTLFFEGNSESLFDVVQSFLRRFADDDTEVNIVLGTKIFVGDAESFIRRGFQGSEAYAGMKMVNEIKQCLSSLVVCPECGYQEPKRNVKDFDREYRCPSCDVKSPYPEYLQSTDPCLKVRNPQNNKRILKSGFKVKHFLTSSTSGMISPTGRWYSLTGNQDHVVLLMNLAKEGKIEGVSPTNVPDIYLDGWDKIYSWYDSLLGDGWIRVAGGKDDRRPYAFTGDNEINFLTREIDLERMVRVVKRFTEGYDGIVFVQVGSDKGLNYFYRGSVDYFKDKGILAFTAFHGTTPVKNLKPEVNEPQVDEPEVNKSMGEMSRSNFLVEMKRFLSVGHDEDVIENDVLEDDVSPSFNKVSDPNQDPNPNSLISFIVYQIKANPDLRVVWKHHSTGSQYSALVTVAPGYISLPNCSSCVRMESIASASVLLIPSNPLKSILVNNTTSLTQIISIIRDFLGLP